MRKINPPRRQWHLPLPGGERSKDFPPRRESDNLFPSWEGKVARKGDRGGFFMVNSRDSLPDCPYQIAIVAWIFLFFPFLAFSQSAGIQVAPSRVAIEQLEKPFQVEKVSEEDLRQFEAKALQKLEDFDGYLEIINEDAYEKDMRELAVEVAMADFKDPDPVLMETVGAFSIKNMLYALLETDNLKNRMRMTNFVLLNPFHWDSKRNIYTGNVKGIRFYELSDSKSSNIEVEIFLVKTQKAFGNEVVEVWEVFLGDMVVK
ncbi:hypothetical protein N9933_02185 [bacterium]|nr:hypothetical protein [bacterium]